MSGGGGQHGERGREGARLRLQERYQQGLGAGGTGLACLCVKRSG